MGPAGVQWENPVMTGREKIEAAFSLAGTRELPAVICYEGIYIRDRWDDLTSCPWWYAHSSDLDHQMAWRREVVEHLGQDWFGLELGPSRRERADVTIEQRQDGVYRFDRSDGTAQRLERPVIGGWAPSKGLHSHRPDRLAHTRDEVDAALPIEEPFDVGSIVGDGRCDLARLELEELGRARYPIGGTISPLWGCYGLWGFEGMMTMVAERPELVRYACERLLVLSIRRVQVAAAAGARGIWIEECLTDMIGPAAFQQLNMPMVQRLVEAIRLEGLRSIYYYCGDPAGKWDLLLATGADALSLEEGKKGWRVDIMEVVERAAGRCTVLGNLDSVNVLDRGDEAELRAAVACQVHAGRRSGGRFIASTGSPITPGTPPQTVRRYTDLVHALGSS